MPSRPLPPSPSHHPPPTTTPLFTAFSLLLLLSALCLRRRKTAPKPPHPFPFSTLYRATRNFSPSHLLGRGGFGSVFRATLRNPTRHVAVKAMDSGSLQGEREFRNELLLAPILAPSDYVCHVIGFSTDNKRRRTRHLARNSVELFIKKTTGQEFRNELLFAPSLAPSEYVCHVIGFSTDNKRRRTRDVARMLLVYDLMPRGSLQDCLLHRKSPELKSWETRFRIVLDVAKGLEFLHHVCENAIIHGDIKPSNILLDGEFRAKIGDFGLARMKSDGDQQCQVVVIEGGAECKKDFQDNGSNFEETESVTTVGLDEFAGPSQSPETSRDPKTLVTEKGSFSEGNIERASVESGRRIGKSRSGKDWWWKQENGGGGGEGVVKDYVMEWIGSEIKKDGPKGNLIGSSSSSVLAKSDRKSRKKRLDWWMAMDDDKDKKREKRRPAREWWKEEYCEELAKKKKKKMKKRGLGSASDGYNSENLRPIDDEMYVDRSNKKKKKKRNGSRKGSYDSDSVVSSTPSTRGTVCYVAPEYGHGDDVSEKCDVYSFGVLMLVVIAGRRPLQVTGSPISEFQRANLISWSRHLARAGKLLDLVDKGVESVDQEQALLCITIALLCIQKSPVKRPSMREVVGMLSGELDSPQLPVEFSPSPPCRFPYRSMKGPVSF